MTNKNTRRRKLQKKIKKIVTKSGQGENTPLSRKEATELHFDRRSLND